MHPRLLLGLALFLSLASTLWSAAGYLSAPAQQIETRAELDHLRATGRPPTDVEVAAHVGRIRQQGRNHAIAATLQGGTCLAIATALLLTSSKSRNANAASPAKLLA